MEQVIVLHKGKEIRGYVVPNSGNLVKTEDNRLFTGVSISRVKQGGLTPYELPICRHWKELRFDDFKKKAKIWHN